MSRSGSTEPIIQDSMQVIQMDETVSRRPSKQYGGTVPWPPTGGELKKFSWKTYYSLVTSKTVLQLSFLVS